MTAPSPTQSNASSSSDSTLLGRLPLSAPERTPWYRWIFSVPLAIFVILFAFLLYRSFLSSGYGQLIQSLGAAAAAGMTLLMIYLQSRDRYPYRLDSHHGKPRGRDHG